MKKDKNDGKGFENVIEWIEKTLRNDENTVIKKDVKVIDKETGEERQIDILIEIKTGYETWIGIIEVRDRSRKVDSTYIEQVIQKKISVDANAAVIVSSKGFFKPAIIKAKKYGIKTLSYQEVEKQNWGEWCKIDYMHEINQLHNRAILHIYNENKDNIGILNGLIDSNDKIILNSKKERILSLQDIVNYALRQDDAFAGIITDQDPVTKRFEILLEDQGLYIQDLHSELHKIAIVQMEVDLLIKTKLKPITYKKYENVLLQEKSTLAAVMSSDLQLGDNLYKIELMKVDGNNEQIFIRQSLVS